MTTHTQIPSLASVVRSPKLPSVDKVIFQSIVDRIATRLEAHCVARDFSDHATTLPSMRVYKSTMPIANERAQELSEVKQDIVMADFFVPGALSLDGALRLKHMAAVGGWELRLSIIHVTADGVFEPRTYVKLIAP